MIPGKKSQLPFYTGLGALLLSSVLLSLTWVHIRELGRHAFEDETAEVQQTFVENLRIIEGLSIHLQSLMLMKPDLTREAFQIFGDGILLHANFVHATHFYRVVPGALRPQHEAWLALHTGAVGLVDTSSDESDATVPAAVQTRYLSLIYADRRAADQAVFGWNVLSDGSRQAALQRAMETAQVMASDVFLLNEGQAAIEVFVPFYQGRIPDEPEARLKEVAGVIGLSLDLPRMLGDESKRHHLSVILSATRDGERTRDLLRFLDKESEGLVRLTTLESESEVQSFGQTLRLLFIKRLYVSRLNYEILILVALGCLFLSLLAVQLVKTRLRLSHAQAVLLQKFSEQKREEQEPQRLAKIS